MKNFQNFKKSKLHKKTTEICDNKSWKLIHGQKPFSSDLLSNSKSDLLLVWKPWKMTNVKKLKTLQVLRK